MNIVFRDPPITKPRRYGGKNIQFFLQLSETPNQWAVLREDCPKATAFVFRSKYGKDFPDTEWVIVCETPNEPDKRTVYVRWVTEAAA